MCANETLCRIRESLPSLQRKGCFRNQHLEKGYSCHTDTFFFFLKWNYLRGGNAVKKCTHGAFRLSKTDIAHVGLGLINCVSIFVGFILVYFFRRLHCCWPGWRYFFAATKYSFIKQNYCVSPSYRAHFRTVSVDSYKPKNVIRAVQARLC